MRLILASASPRRHELLASAGLTFETRAVDVDERLRPGESAAAYVSRLAAEKSARVFEDDPALADGDVVALGADTAVVVDGEILGKPASDLDARAMLQRLSDRAHEVLTGISLRTGTREAGSVETTTVWFAPLSALDVEWYVATGEGRDKAGGYAIQGLAARFVVRIDGSYSNVVGLPIAQVCALLRRFGAEMSTVASQQ
jgi:septum formation protein